MKMLILLTSLIFCFTLVVRSAQAQSATQTLVLRVQGKKLKFVSDSRLGITVSSSCARKDHYECKAYSAWQSLSGRKIDVDLKHGRNPGAQICKAVLNGNLITATDSAGNENSFCSFSDGSMIDTGSLRQYSEL